MMQSSCPEAPVHVNFRPCLTCQRADISYQGGRLLKLVHAVLRMQGHPSGTGLTLEQKKSKLWGNKAAPAVAVPVSHSFNT